MTTSAQSIAMRAASSCRFLLAAAGLTLRMQHYSSDEDWLPFLLAVFMLVGGPILTLTFSAAAWGIEHIVLPRPLEP